MVSRIKLIHFMLKAAQRVESLYAFDRLFNTCTRCLI